MRLTNVCMLIKVDEMNKFTRSTTPPALAIYSHTDVDALSVSGM